jgi:hypothetical protein
MPTPEPLSFADGPGDAASWWAMSRIACELEPGSIAITFCSVIGRSPASRALNVSMLTLRMPARRI